MIEEELTSRLDELTKKYDVLSSIVTGNPELGLTGTAKRLSSLEKEQESLKKQIDALAKEREEQKAMLKGIIVGLGLTGIGSIGSLVAILSQITGIS